MQKNKKSGLPGSLTMRHDDHFVELLSERTAIPNVRVISIEKIDPNPMQARNELGEIEELTNSIKEKGILEPILVRPTEGRYEIIAGERRFVAAKKAGMDIVPCIVMEVSENEAMEISLVENLQRKDLDVFEEADGLKALVDNYGYNHEKISKKIGKARSTITEIINLSKIPNDVRMLCNEYDIKSRSMLIEIAKLKSKDDMIKLLYQIKDRGLKRDDTRELSKEMKGKKTPTSRRYVYNYKYEGDEYCRLRMEFRRSDINREKIIEILTDIIDKLKGN